MKIERVVQKDDSFVIYLFTLMLKVVPNLKTEFNFISRIK
jgi:hypothetical protein